MEKHNYIGKTKEEAINIAKEELQEVTYKLAAKVYEQANQNTTDSNEESEDKKDETIKEAEFEEKEYYNSLT